MDVQNIYWVKSENGKVKVSILTLNKLDFKAKSIIRDNKNSNKGRYKNNKYVGGAEF